VRFHLTLRILTKSTAVADSFPVPVPMTVGC